MKQKLKIWQWKANEGIKKFGFIVTRRWIYYLLWACFILLILLTLSIFLTPVREPFIEVIKNVTRLSGTGVVNGTG